MKYQINIGSELYDAGEGFEAERFFVVATTPKGRRFHHEMIISGASPRNIEGDVFFVDVRAEAKEKLYGLVRRIENHLRAGGDLDFAHWDEVDPAYGSNEYLVQGIEDQRWFEERYA